MCMCVRVLVQKCGSPRLWISRHGANTLMSIFLILISSLSRGGTQTHTHTRKKHDDTLPFGLCKKVAGG